MHVGKFGGFIILSTTSVLIRCGPIYLQVFASDILIAVPNKLCQPPSTKYSQKLEMSKKCYNMKPVEIYTHYLCSESVMLRIAKPMMTNTFNQAMFNIDMFVRLPESALTILLMAILPSPIDLQEIQT